MAEANRNLIVSHGGSRPAGTFLRGQPVPDSVADILPDTYVIGRAHVTAAPPPPPVPPTVVPARATIDKITDRAHLIAIAKQVGAEFKDTDDVGALRRAIVAQIGPS